jgi:hypothetical protein
MVDPSSGRREPTATGTLEATPLAHALVYARNRRLTGTLEVSAPNGKRGEVELFRGRIRAARVHPRTHYLGPIVYELGMIDTPTLDATLLEVAQGRRLHGELLVERRAITAEQRDLALVEQACRKVHHLFGYPRESTFAFYDEPPGDAPAVLLDPIAPVWRGIRDAEPDAHAAEVLARVASGLLRMVNEAPVLVAGLSREERALCSALESHPMGLADLCAATSLDARRVERLAYLLVITKCVELCAHAPAEAPPPSLPVPTENPPRTTTPGPRFSTAPPRLSTPSGLPPAPSSLPPRRPSFGPLSMPPAALPRSRDDVLRDLDRLLTRGELESAELVAEGLASADADDVDARAVLAWVRARGGEAQADLLRASIAELDRAISADRTCSRAYFYRGSLHKRLGNAQLAHRDFVRAAHLDPRNVDAEREVRLFELRARKGSGEHATLGAILSKVRGKK